MSTEVAQAVKKLILVFGVRLILNLRCLLNYKLGCENYDLGLNSERKLTQKKVNEPFLHWPKILISSKNQMFFLFIIGHFAGHDTR